jgi:tetratricopeptide (TPR) repeat protein
MACLAEAVRRDPSYPEAWAMLAIVGLDRYRWGDRVGASAGPIVASADEAAARALELAPRNTLVLEAASAVRFHEGDTAEAERLIRQAVALNPDNPETLALLGVRVALPGRWEEGLGYLDRAVDRTLRPPTWLLVARAMARYMLGDFRGALPDAEDGQGCCAGMGMVLLAAVRGQLGDGEAAHAALAVALARSPVLGRDPRAFLAPWQLREADVARLLDGLRRAGLGGTSS